MTKVLVVDDNKNDRMLLSTMLTSNNYQVAEACNGIEALKSVKTSKPAIIISDVFMPGMDGFRLLRELKKQKNTKDIPFVLYTAHYVSEKDRELAERLGASRYIIKPEEPRKLLHEIEIAMKEHEAGLIKPVEPLISTDEEYLRTYSERIVRKLEEKVKELETEIVERKKAEEELTKHREHLTELVNGRTNELRKSETKYRTLYESSSDAIMMLDEKGFFDCNNATLRMFGFSEKDDFTKVHPADVSPPYQPDGIDSLTAANNKIAEAFRKGTNFFEWVHRRKNGEDFPAEVLLTAFQLGETQVLQATVRDITERKRTKESLRLARDEAECASMAKTNFLMTMSHELRTPLNAILGFSEILKLKTMGELNEKQERFIDNIITGGNNLHNIISQILDVVQAEEGTLELRIEKFSVPETVDEVIRVIKDKAATKNVLFEKNLDPQLEHIEADKQKIKQVFINLIDNAVKFSKEKGGTITIIARKEGNMAKFSVSDTGIGIKEEDMETIFKKFTQLDNGTTRKYGGTGLGLAISKQFVELHGGTISVESKFGKGSTFIFGIPLKDKSRRNNK